MKPFLQPATDCKEEKAISLYARDAIKLLAFEIAIIKPVKAAPFCKGDAIKNNLLILMTGPDDAVKINIAAQISIHAGRRIRILDGSMPGILPAATGAWETLLERARENDEIIFIKHAPLLFGRVPSERVVKINLKRVLGLIKYYRVPVIASGISVCQFCSSFTNSSVGSIQTGQSY